ncbi:hypothetical protein F3Y22_tig00112980pilonHSYRG00037 [Hibiscus syriacus]|uniref:Uncharacterized protein n=1 Tax=Hibiscus syriacus TaxID=106335 RepID=A0A6A2Y1H4_HIBSY|nr:uncharacterized protein LOC120184940 [Hibiscus syriacus]KAE8663427.1 hypothetical protein F3Y22_tig00112980pilonHSYRG00037 [Hibiscus syriacus]
MAATPQEKPAQAKETRPLRAEDEDYSQDFEDPLSSSFCGGCFRGIFRWRHGYLLQYEENRESWVKRRAKKLQEISELLAGPRWKNFIRRFSIYGINKKRRSTTMQYDIQSYELNFDEGVHREADAGYLGFSARFAAPAGINKG